MPEVLPVSIVIPTRNRAASLRRTLESLAVQSSQPAQIVLVDGSSDRDTVSACVERPVRGLASALNWVPAAVLGAAAQRNQGIALCRHDVIGFFDDDILLEAECMARLFRTLTADSSLGGVSAMIVNQNYSPPGMASRLVFRVLAGRRMASYAGCLLGPAVNLLPEDRADLPETVPVEWLNTTCTLYRREALPDPPFPGFFTGYSMMEDVTLSVCVARNWKIANVRTARIYHDSQPGDHKSDPVSRASMELTNRHYVMIHVLGRSRFRDYAKLTLWEFFQLGVCAIRARGGREFWLLLRGKCRAIAGLARPPSKDAGS
jgi:glycosyltransferase involved in cell wall biosynthesis